MDFERIFKTHFFLFTSSSLLSALLPSSVWQKCTKGVNKYVTIQYSFVQYNNLLNTCITFTHCAFLILIQILNLIYLICDLHFCQGGCVRYFIKRYIYKPFYFWLNCSKTIVILEIQIIPHFKVIAR